ncbi:MAG: 2-amino-4-hydroxy-6-hydroxymethyldihydropteridine diphosphokinase [Alphaproteobacteria bacterium]|nr:2-amino-4-hydroxy-6-hydroxymethyldihydropteridine diphosphokinase [Alphaproteobacteria bacterium]
MINEAAFVAFGANLPGPAGSPLDTFRAAAALLARRGVHFTEASSVYASDPWGGIRQPVFLNGVWEIRTVLSPHRLMVTLLDVERQLGRRRRVRWGPRVIDLDLLAFGARSGSWQSGAVGRGAMVDLELPHPRMGDRAFVLLPLAEIAPMFKPWGDEHCTVSQMAEKLPIRERFTIRRQG